MFVNSVVLVVILATFASAQRLVIPGSTDEIEARCRDENKLTLEQLKEWEATSIEQCRDIIGETAEGRCYYACILRELKFDNSFDPNALYALFSKVDHERIDYYFKKCIVNYLNAGHSAEGCDAVYYIYKCVAENLGAYPPGVLQPHACFETPEVREECRKRFNLTEQDVCNAIRVLEDDKFERDHNLMCYHDCLLKLLKYINDDLSLNWEVIYEAFNYLGKDTIKGVIIECDKKFAELKGCEYTYHLHKCIRQDFGELPADLW